MKTTTRDNRTAAQAYEENARAIEALTHTLKNELFRHKHQAAAEPRNWGYVGDLAHVRELLQQAVSFMTGEEE
jgi:hypothetical protein